MRATSEPRSRCSRGPHGRDIHAALIASWDADNGPNKIACLRGQRRQAAGHRGESPGQASPSQSTRCAPERAISWCAPWPRNGCSRLWPRARIGRKGAGELAPVSEKLAPPLALRAIDRRRPGISRGPRGRGKSRTQSAADIDRRRAWHRQGDGCTRHSRRQPSRQGPLLALTARPLRRTSSTASCSAMKRAPCRSVFLQIGKLVQVDGGTLILDEIAALPAETQERLDRVLATGEVRPVGLNGSHSIDVRVIATSSRQLPENFHAALAERIAATTVNLPPLRERSGDIPASARHLLTRFTDHAGMRSLSIGNDALAVLMRYGWPGNVRQLAGVPTPKRPALRRHIADRRAFPAHRDPVALRQRRSDFSPILSRRTATKRSAGLRA